MATLGIKGLYVKERAKSLPEAFYEIRFIDLLPKISEDRDIRCAKLLVPALKRSKLKLLTYDEAMLVFRTITPPHHGDIASIYIPYKNEKDEYRRFAIGYHAEWQEWYDDGKEDDQYCLRDDTIFIFKRRRVLPKKHVYIKKRQ